MVAVYFHFMSALVGIADTGFARFLENLFAMLLYPNSSTQSEV
jgi:hypothetical protein